MRIMKHRVQLAENYRTGEKRFPPGARLDSSSDMICLLFSALSAFLSLLMTNKAAIIISDAVVVLVVIFIIITFISHSGSCRMNVESDFT